MIRPIIQNYKRNLKRENTFDLIDSHDEANIPFFIISKPKQIRFERQGAVKIMESWTSGTKSLFSGLILLKRTKNVYFGNRKESGKRKSLFCIIEVSNDLIELVYYKQFCPRKRTDQISLLLRYFNPQLHPTND